MENEINVSSPAVPYEDAVFIAVELGEHVMRSGGEISRAEDTVSRICKAYGAHTVDVTAILSVIVVTADFGSVSINTSRRITEIGSHNLGRLSRLNNLSRRICRERPQKEDFLCELESINQKSRVSPPVSMVGAILAAAGFVVYFGGDLFDALCSGLIAIPMTLLLGYLLNTQMNNIIAKFIVCLLGGVLAMLVGRTGLGCNVDKIMIGNIMNVIPGVLLANSFRDLFGGEIMSGFFRMCTAVLDAVAIAFGYAVAILAFGGVSFVESENWGLAMILVASTVGTMGIILQFGIEKRVIIWALIASVLCSAGYEIAMMFGCGFFLSSLIASAIAAAYSDFMAHMVKVPATVMIIPAIVPLVPGGRLYYTMLGAVREDMALFSSSGSSALQIAAGLAMGIIVVTAISRPLNAKLAELSQKIKTNK
jgi:uncharacterized membrane protein YjjP (DUF1212 family)